MAVGCGWQAFVAYVNVGCYYVVGIPLGSLFGFYFNLGAKVTINFILFFFLLTQDALTSSSFPTIIYN